MRDSSVVFIGEEEVEAPPKKRKTGNSHIFPYFPRSFLKYLLSQNSILFRIFSSLCPPIGLFNRIAVDFTGSLLSTFILSATIYWGLVNGSVKGGGDSPTSSRLLAMIHSAALNFGYLGVVSAGTWGISKITKTRITFRQIICILGYGLFGHALVLLLCEAGSRDWFMNLMTIIGGLDSMRICLIFLWRTPVPACRFVLCTPVAILHLLYLSYLHFVIMKGK